MKPIWIVILCILFSACQMKRRDLASESTTGIDLNMADYQEDYVEDVTDDMPFYEEESHLNPVSFDNSNPDYAIYEVKRNDTLMQVSFNLYSDITKWRQILRDNQDQLNGSQALRVGMNLRIRKPLKVYKYPRGLPYMIRWNDSLSLISKKVYGTMKYWPHIYRNNTEQIKDPNLIFAGFTLFYLSVPELHRNENYMARKETEQTTF